MLTGDGAYIKKINRQYILKVIYEEVKISRANLAKVTGLNKATVSVQVNDLINDELICETREEHNVVGRRPILLSINESAAFFLGIDLDYDYILFNITNLKGDTVKYEKIELNTDIYEEIADLVANRIKHYEQEYSWAKFGLAQTYIAVHGTVSTDEVIHFIPTYQWRDKDLKDDLIQKGINYLHVENNANLAAYAERVFHYHTSDNLILLNLSSGIGSGIIINGELHRGFHGHAGEMGHMIIYPKGRPCRCGNEGCWERYASEPAFFDYANRLLDHRIYTEQDVTKLIEVNNDEIITALNKWIADISIGINNIINLYNPEMIVLNSPILGSYKNSLNEINKHLTSSVSHYRDIVISGLGAKSAVVGACAMGIQNFLELPDLSLNATNNSVSA
ncbi:Sugar kinase of the NBD/HSP70 family, may contain an N-terminal HTH domain [Gracilibacillus ureilyticus]|uniref:Sugar kinase of the NBD/HSP70 family, may contain an N-terminal HTH domain n=1 Tax=Gracilibacillus ureilyticus TaxID=531814 RepID=A0A1H9PHK2_9BACI|nr:ROK family transcriptional regulator [Gracilibacillus ureilyticus]SER47756.1 Sugar kinase of the NBD/HSP70 family, may contain an N-terminal HTH domain [Gracilibacillus ureilyticus]